MSRLGDTIQTVRLKQGITEKQLAKKCGLAESCIKDIESGRRIVSDDQAQRILKVLGIENPISTELEVAAEPDTPLRPKPKPLVAALVEKEKHRKRKPDKSEEQKAPDEAWIDALSGILRRVPVLDTAGREVGRELCPVFGGQINGGPSEKVFFFNVPDDQMSGYHIFKNDRVLVVPDPIPAEGVTMLVIHKGERVIRRLRMLGEGKLSLITFTRRVEEETVVRAQVLVIGRCVRLVRPLIES